MKETSMNKDVKLSLSHSNEFDAVRLSPHFTLGELTKTSYDTLDKNIPSRVAIENLRNICENWLEDLRYSYNALYGEGGVTREGQAPLCSASCAQDGASPCVSLYGDRRQESGVSRNDGEIPIIISSGYRSEEVNRLCGGAKGSNHLTGCAVDIRCYGPEQLIRMAGILLDIADGTKRDFDELILEKRGTTYWVHFAVWPKDNRRKILFDCR